MTIAYIPVASQLHDPASMSRLAADVEQALADIGMARYDGMVADGDAVAFTLVLTGGVEAEAIRRYRSRVQQGKPPLALLIAHPGHNSLPAALEILAQVRQEGGQGRIFLLRGPADESAKAAIRQTADCLAANHRLAEDRIGLIGASSDWLIASSQRAEIVAKRLGTRVLALDVGELLALIAHLEVPESGPEFTVWDRARSRHQLEPVAFARAVAVYRALKEMIRLHRLDALTLRCFDLVERGATTGCLALAMLTDEGITAGCEGDVPSVLMLRWLWHLTGQVAWMANPADIREATGELLVAHCTVPLSMTREHALNTHFESGLGVGIDGTFTPGPVTLLRLGGAELDRWWGAEGTLMENRHGADACRTQAWIQVSPESAGDLLRNPLGNHVVVVAGHQLARFREAFALSQAAAKARS